MTAYRQTDRQTDRQTAYRVMFQQTKVNETTKPLIVSEKERENCICQNVQNLSYWNRYFVIYPHKCTLNNLKKKYQEKWENAYVTVKNAGASRALGPHQYWLALLTRLRFATSAKSRKKFLGLPLDQILDLLVDDWDYLFVFLSSVQLMSWHIHLNSLVSGPQWTVLIDSKLNSLLDARLLGPIDMR